MDIADRDRDHPRRCPHQLVLGVLVPLEGVPIGEWEPRRDDRRRAVVRLSVWRHALSQYALDDIGGTPYRRAMQTERPVAFVASADLERSRTFYVDVLGLEPVSMDEFALAVRAGPVPIRVTHVPDHAPVAFTVLGWEVDDLAGEVAALAARGVATTRYPWFEQDDDGIWTAPSGDRVAWFADPDGNVLSFSQPAPAS